MTIPFRARALAALALCAALVLAPAATAFAHVAKSFGRVHVEMGFGDEPTYTGQPNSVFLGIERNGKPVTDLTDTLKVTAPTNQQLSDLIAAQTGRLEAAAAHAHDAADTARTIGLIGVLLGAIGVIAAIGALVRARKQT